MVVETELVGEPARGLAPPPQRDEVDVEQPVDRNAAGGREHRPAEAATLLARQLEAAAEEVGEDRQQVVARAVEHTLVRGAAAEHRLRDQAVDDDERREREREPIDPQQLQRPAATGPEHNGERADEQHVLPGGDRRQPRPVHARAVELRHDQVVQREPDDQYVQRPDRPPADEAHRGPTAISVIPLLSTRTL